jgi:prepilin-type N-terminal cleavage/methylation domain-containing protein
MSPTSSIRAGSLFSASRRSRSNACVRGSRAFTLIELMVVVALIGLIMSMGIPFVYHALNKDPMRQAVSNVMDACNNARATAILNGTPTKLTFQLDSRSMQISQVTRSPATRGSSGASRQASGSTIPEDVVIERLGVNFQEMQNEREAEVNFYPNGTSDEFTIVLFWPDKNERQVISLDVITGLANVEIK